MLRKFMKNRELCLQLAYCETEKEVIDLLVKQGLWDNPMPGVILGITRITLQLLAISKVDQRGLWLKNWLIQLMRCSWPNVLKEELIQKVQRLQKYYWCAIKILQYLWWEIIKSKSKRRGRLAENIYQSQPVQKQTLVTPLLIKGKDKRLGECLKLIIGKSINFEFLLFREHSIWVEQVFFNSVGDAIFSS